MFSHHGFTETFDEKFRLGFVIESACYITKIIALQKFSFQPKLIYYEMYFFVLF